MSQAHIELLISSLPKQNGWYLETLYKYQGFWFEKPLLKGLLLAQQTFNAQPHNVILATFPKSGTTWFSALLFSLINRNRYDFSTHPLLTSNPHDCVPGLEFNASKNPSNPTIDPFKNTIVATHIPYSLLPESIIDFSSSNCPIVYVWRDSCDVFVSLWQFANKLRSKELQPLGLEEAFDMFCQGKSPFGAYWDHALEYWHASLERPNKVLLMRYEDMKSQPIAHLKKLANFVGCPFNLEEEENSLLEKILEFCSFESLTSFKINQVEIKRATVPGVNITNKSFFRKGEVGDHKNYLSGEMILRLRGIMEKKFEGSGFQLHLE